MAQTWPESLHDRQILPEQKKQTQILLKAQESREVIQLKATCSDPGFGILAEEKVISSADACIVATSCSCRHPF